jgi:hypothetical protein
MGRPTTRENPKRPLEQRAPIGALVHARDDIRPCVPVAFEKRDQRRRCALVLQKSSRSTVVLSRPSAWQRPKT